MNLNVVVPFYNEELCAAPFVRGLMAALAAAPDIEPAAILVDDGSTDATPGILDGLAAADPRISVIHLWSNHGHQRALIAGLDRCRGDAVLMLDGDGQHPPAVAVELIARLRAEPETAVVQAVRRGRQAGRVKNAASAVFYWTIRRLLPDADLRPGASDFRVMRAPAVALVNRYPDRHRNLRVLLASLKLPTTCVEYEVAPRMAGSSHYRLSQMLTLARDGWFAFSTSPLRASLMLMCGSGALGIAYLVYGLIVYWQNKTTPGWTSLVALVCFFFSAVFGVLAILSEYVARIYEDVRRHPVYRVRPEPGSSAPPAEPPRDGGDGT